MRLTLADRRSRSNCASREGMLALSIGDELDAPHARREPQALNERTVAVDPYTAWLAEREAKRAPSELDSVRWVYRHPRVTRPARTDAV